MRTLLMAVLLAVCCLAMSGCFTFDMEHNRQIVRYMKSDIRGMHEDLDFILAMDEESPLAEIYMR